MTREYSRILVKVIFDLGKPLKSQICNLKTDFCVFQVHLLELNAFKLLSHSLKLNLNVHIRRSHRILLDRNPF